MRGPAAVLKVLWTALIVKFNPHDQAICAAMPHLALTLEIASAGVAFLIGTAPGRSDP
jgi:hypothetical protein